MKKISTCLWFNNEAEEAVKLYAEVFKNSRVGKVARYGESLAKVSGQKAGSVMTAELQIEDLQLLALNGGPMFKFTPAKDHPVFSFRGSAFRKGRGSS